MKTKQVKASTSVAQEPRKVIAKLKVRTGLRAGYASVEEPVAVDGYQPQYY
jgi:hypothetical protein